MKLSNTVLNEIIITTIVQRIKLLVKGNNCQKWVTPEIWRFPVSILPSMKPLQKISKGTDTPKDHKCWFWWCPPVVFVGSCNVIRRTITVIPTVKY